jgi:hypothetical protein
MVSFTVAVSSFTKLLTLTLPYPVQPAFTMSVNKSQWQTLQCTGILLDKLLFTHGEMYVIASRCSDCNSICFFFNNDYCQTANVVYSKVLLYFLSQTLTNNIVIKLRACDSGPAACNLQEVLQLKFFDNQISQIMIKSNICFVSHYNFYDSRKGLCHQSFWYGGVCVSK